MIHYVPYLIAFHIITNDILVAMAYTPHPVLNESVLVHCFQLSIIIRMHYKH